MPAPQTLYIDDEFDQRMREELVAMSDKLKGVWLEWRPWNRIGRHEAYIRIRYVLPAEQKLTTISFQTLWQQIKADELAAGADGDKYTAPAGSSVGAIWSDWAAPMCDYADKKERHYDKYSDKL